MVVYPIANYNSFISVADADTYFSDRLNAGPWDAATDQEAALVTAYRSLAELDIIIDLSDTDQLQAIKNAQCEQALWEVSRDLDSPKLDTLSLGGLLNIKLPQGKDEPARFSPRALNIIRLYLRARSVARTR